MSPVDSRYLSSLSPHTLLLLTTTLLLCLSSLYQISAADSAVVNHQKIRDQLASLTNSPSQNHNDVDVANYDLHPLFRPNSPENPLKDNIFNPNLKHEGFSSKDFYAQPTIHPFENEDQLRREAKRDPFGGFSTNHFRANFMETRMLQGEYQRSRSPQAKRLLQSHFGEGKNIQKHIQQSYPRHLGGQQVSLKYDVDLVNGLVSLNAESDMIQSVECHTADQKLRIHLKDSKYMSEVARWIPGSRFIVGPEWNCERVAAEVRGEQLSENHFERKPHYKLLVRRHKISSTIVEYDTKELTEQDCYSRSDVEFHYKPNEDLLEEQLDTIEGTFKDTSLMGSRLSEVPAFETLWKQQEHKSIQKRFSTDSTKYFDLLNFNYNRASGRAEKVIDFFNEYKYGVSAKAKCTNCFAYMGFELHFKMTTTFVWIDEFHASVTGRAKFAFETLLDIRYSYNKVWEKKNIISKQLGQIQFSVGPIPVIIHPSVNLGAKLQVNVAAKLQLTHKASYKDSLTFGVKYDKHGIQRIYDRSYPDLTISKPKLSDDSEATANAKLTLIPNVRLNFYAVSPLDLTAMPYIRLAARVGNAACGRYGASYNTYWGMQMAIQLQKLTIPKTVYGIGGKQFDLGGVLPYPSSFSDATFTIVSDRALSCSYCSGCQSLTNLWSKSTSRSVVPSFLEASSVDRRSLPSSNDSPSVIELGQSVHDREIPSAGQCHLYQTTSLDAAIAPNEIFGTDALDTRQSQITLETIPASSDVEATPLTVYWDQTEEPVTGKTTTHSATVATTKLLSEKWQKVVFAVCNEQSETVPGTKYSFQTKAAAEISRFHVMSPELTLKEGSVLRLMIREKKTLSSVIDRAIFTNKQLAGDVDMAVSVYAVDNEQQLFHMDKKFLVLDAKKQVEDVSLVVNSEAYPHHSFDYLIIADIFARKSGNSSRFQSQANGMFHTHLRKPQPITSNMNFVQVKRSHVAIEDIWKYHLHVKRSTTSGSEEICLYTGQLSNVNLDPHSKQCFTIPDGEDEAYFAYYIPEDVVKFGMDYFMIEIVGDFHALNSHTITEITVDEHRYVRSGEMMSFDLRGPSEGGDRFILFNTEDALHADKLLVSGRTYIRPDVPCVAGGCYVDMRITLVDAQANEKLVDKWSVDVQSDIDGYIHREIDYSAVKKELSPEDAARVHEFKFVVDVISNDDASTYYYNLLVDEVTEASLSRTEFVDRVTHQSRTSEMMFYRIPRAVINKFGGACIVDVNSVNDNTREGTADDGKPMPHVYLQKGSLPRFSSYIMAGSQEPGNARLAFYADGSADYYVGVTTQSEKLNYKMSLSELDPATVDIEYYTNGKTGSEPTFSLEDMKKTGFSIKFTLSSEEQAWSPRLTDPLPSTTCKKLLAIFKANGDIEEWELLQNHMLDTLLDAFNPDSPTDPATFIEYSEKVITLNFPPFKVGNIRLSHDMTVNVDTTLDKDLFVTQDSRITVRSGKRFFISKNSIDWVYIIVPIVAICLFLVVLAAGVSVVGFIMYRAVLESKNQQIKDKLMRRKAKKDLKEEFLGRELGEDGSLEMDDVMSPEPAAAH